MASSTINRPEQKTCSSSNTTISSLSCESIDSKLSLYEADERINLASNSHHVPHKPSLLRLIAVLDLTLRGHDHPVGITCIHREVCRELHHCPINQVTLLKVLHTFNDRYGVSGDVEMGTIAFYKRHHSYHQCHKANNILEDCDRFAQKVGKRIDKYMGVPRNTYWDCRPTLA